jgi:hypothetical protein
VNRAFIINLDTQEELFTEVQQQMLPYGLVCERFVVTPDEHKQIGCSISHLELIARAKEEGWPYLIVLEDDCTVRTAMEAWPAIAQYLLRHQDRWDIFLGGSTQVHPKELQLDFQPETSMNVEIVACLHAVTAHFIIYNKNSYDRLLRWHDLPEPLEQRPLIDQFFEKCQLKILTPSPMIAWQKPRPGNDFTEFFKRAEEKLSYFTQSLRCCLKYRLFGRWMKTIQ